MLYIIMGKSATGKDRIFRLIRDLHLAKPIVTATTRPPRPNEINNVDYQFKSRSEFADMIANHKFLEYRSYVTTVGGKRDEWFYGTPSGSINASIDQVIVLPPQAVRQILGNAHNLLCKVILVTASDETRKDRAEHRGAFDETEWNRRFAYDKLDFSHAEDLADMTFVNDKPLSYDELAERIKTEIFGMMTKMPNAPSKNTQLTPLMMHQLEKLTAACSETKHILYDDGNINGTSGIMISCDKLIEQINNYIASL